MHCPNLYKERAVDPGRGSGVLTPTRPPSTHSLYPACRQPGLGAVTPQGHPQSAHPMEQPQRVSPKPQPPEPLALPHPSGSA